MNKRRVLVLFLSVVLLVGLSACKDNKTPEDNDNDNPTTGTRIGELYEDLERYEERLNTLVGDGDVEMHIPDRYRMAYDIQFLSETTYEIYTRDQLIERLETYTPNQIEGQYLENLITTQLFVSTVKELIADDLDQEVGVEFHPDEDNEDLTYRFLLSDEGYVIIDAKNRFMKTFIKIGMQDDLLDYTELHYRFDEDDIATLGDNRLLYNYFKFEEGQETVFINNLEFSSSMSYTSLEDNLYFTIEQSNSLEGAIGESGYHISYYNAEDLLQVYMDVVDNDVVDATYDVFTEHGLLYRYETNYDYVDMQRIATNFIQATGYDYVKIDSAPGTQEVEGVYLDSGEALYNGFLNFTYNDNYAFASVKQLLEQGEPLTDEILSLQSLGMNLDHPKATASYLNSILITDMMDVSQNFTIENLDFFTDTREQELYNYLDPDIRASLEGTNDPTVHEEPEGDIDEFESMMNAFTTAFEEERQLVIEDQFGLGETITNTNGYAKTSISLDDKYLGMYTYGSSAGQHNYYVRPYYGKLIGLTRYNAGNIYNAEILYATDSSENFLDFLTRTTNIFTPLMGVEQVTKVSDTEFTVEGNFDFLGISSEKIFSNSDFAGYIDSDVTATFTFESDHSGYAIDFEVDGIYHEYGGVEYQYEGVRTYTLEPIMMFDPIAEENNYINLPTSKDDIILTTPIGVGGSYSIDQQPRYMRLDLEEGIYNIHISQRDFQYILQIQDELGNVITNEETFRVDVPGIYYLVIESVYHDSIGIMVEQSSVNLDDVIVLPEEPGKLAIELEADVLKMIQVPISNQDRILYIHIDLDDFNYIEEMRPGFGMTFDPEDKFGAAWVPLYETDGMVYLYLKANVPYFFNVAAEITDTYYVYFEFIEQPTSETAIADINLDNILDHPGLFFNAFQDTIRVHFTITEETTYDFNYERFFLYGGLEYNLYTSDGGFVKDLSFGYTVLTPGDYYIEYVNTEPDDIAAIVPHFMEMPTE
ncbi:hypothetical protein [Candidatus Xianfuyuplasma coldseepsis]|uniref:Uncharacterized protein n=1 Tax=Candidatus Xianfuyuplasma coldseepsis TaxID=2782163 RepID=A0A7L7KSD5_9MOLU|nr:hypothetical protein [Xianfuyuplasma coldseepsis]QMS84698.1 hypothetical protein G4Z02_02665 [Xianfuyuplasma coldseepsis]